jgi:uncharacterized membrane protein YhaH (DUF805 family)
MRLIGLLSPYGGLGRGAFIGVAALFYGIALAAHMLTAPAFLMRFGLLPFLLSQVVLTWLWFVLHAKRLHDAGRAAAPAGGAAALYLLGLVLLLLLGAFFLDEIAVTPGRIIGTPLLLSIAAAMFAIEATPVGVTLVVLLLAAVAALLVPLGFSVWAAGLASAGPRE